MSDRFGKTTVVTATWLGYGVSLLLIATVQSIVGLWIAVSVYALLTGMGEGAEKALVSDLATDANRGTAFGWYNMVVGLAAIPAGLLFGAIWPQATAGTAFAAFGALAIASSVLLRFPYKIIPTNGVAP